jgi:glucose-6-phosphate dehydrogenase assembly protein OpcA
VSDPASPRAVLEHIDAELRALWTMPPAPGQMPTARACTMNLVVVASSPALAEAWVPVVDQVVLAVPARAIIVGLDVDGADGLEAGATAVCTPSASGGPAVCSERITLVARGRVCARLPSCVATLCATDVPTTLVWLGRVHADDPVFEPLARDASRIVLDAAQGSLGSLANVVYWARARAGVDRPGVADLAWTRIAPWQELCARMFDEPRLRPLASRVSRVVLVQACAAGAPLASEGALLLGWLATRLGWKAASLAGKLRLVRQEAAAGARGGDTAEAHVQATLRAEPTSRLAPGTLLGVRLEAAGPDATMRGEIARAPGDADAVTWRLEVTRTGAEPQRIEQHVQLPSTGAAERSGPSGVEDPARTARLLERTLHRRTHDPALADAAAWADELRGEELACT